MVGLSARFDVMEIMEKRVKSRFSHRRDIVLELDAAGFDHPGSGVPSLLAAMLALPVCLPHQSCPCLIRQCFPRLSPPAVTEILVLKFWYLEDVGSAHKIYI